MAEDEKCICWKDLNGRVLVYSRFCTEHGHLVVNAGP